MYCRYIVNPYWSLLCLQNVQDEWLFFFFFFLYIFLISTILSSFSNATSVGRRLDILKYYPAVIVRIRIDYWWNAETTIIHQDLWLEKLIPSSHQRSEFNNTILCIFSRWDQSIGEDNPIADFVGEEATFINIYISNGGLKCLCVLISSMPSFGNKVICWYTDFTFETFI